MDLKALREANRLKQERELVEKAHNVGVLSDSEYAQKCRELGTLDGALFTVNGRGRGLYATVQVFPGEADKAKRVAEVHVASEGEHWTRVLLSRAQVEELLRQFDADEGDE